MPSSPPTCPLCQEEFISNYALRRHLSLYISEWRLPADGIHDVLRVQNAICSLRPSSYNLDGNHFYKCWTCSKTIWLRWRFIQHVVCSGHCGMEQRDSGRRRRHHQDFRTWRFPFAEESVLVREKPFPFLRLPLELRLMVYEFLFCFEYIYLDNMSHVEVHWHRKEISLQHNPSSNLLAIMSTGRQIYDEARRTFYSRNNFRFTYLDIIPVFIAGIGADNAKLLRSLSWEDGKFVNQDYADHIQSLLMNAVPSGQIPSLDLQMKLIKDQNLDWGNVTMEPYRKADHGFDEFDHWVRPDIGDNTFSPSRQRFELRVCLEKNAEAKPRATTVGFELYR